MPTLSEAEVKALVAAGSIAGITVDTSIFDRYGCNLQYASLRKLDQFQGGPVHFLLSDVIAGEVESHIRRDAIESQRELKKALRAHKHRWALSDQEADAPATFKLSGDPTDTAKQQLAAFVAATGAEMVAATELNTVAPEVLRRYFAAEPPFEDSEKKKHEFPDAFALISLEAIAAATDGQKILCVSADSGWAAFADQSDHLICMEDLEAALSLFNQSGSVVAQRTVGLLRSGSAPNVLQAIDNALEYRLEDCDFEIDANAPVFYEAEPSGAIAQVIHGESAGNPVVIASDDESVTFTTTLRATVGFEASFSYSVRDWYDGDYVSLGTESEYVEEDIEFEVALTVTKVEDGEPEVIETEVSRQRFYVDFGYVEPFKNEDPTHEKY